MSLLASSLVASALSAVALGSPVGAAGLGTAIAAGGARPAPRAQLLVTIDPAGAGPVIPASFLGLSMETPAVHSPAIASTAPSLTRLMSNLGPGVLRISGASVDRTQWLPSPSPAAPWALTTLTPVDIGHLADLMRATGWQLALGLDLGHPMAATIGEEAVTASSMLGSSLAALEIGNEPDLYTRRVPAPFRAALGSHPLRPARWGYRAYAAEVATMRAALAQAGVRAPLWGPDTATGSWLDKYGAQAPAELATLTQHLYPFDRCIGGKPTRGPALSSLLALKTAAHESSLIRHFVSTAARHRLSVRIDETNSVACAGQRGVSDTFGAALWALRYSLTAAGAGVVGLNFHGGLGPCGSGGTIEAPWYSPLCSLPGGQLLARPEYYALLLVRSLEGMTLLRTSYRTSRNVSVSALRAPDGTLRVVVDDLEAPGRRTAPIQVALRVAGGYRQGTVTRLTAPRIDARFGVRLGGASVLADGTLAPARAEPIAGSTGRFALAVGPGSAAIATLSP